MELLLITLLYDMDFFQRPWIAWRVYFYYSVYIGLDSAGFFNYSNKLIVSWKALDEVKINNQIWLQLIFFLKNGMIIKTIQFLKISGIGQFLFLVFIYFSICSNLTWLLHLNNCLKSEKKCLCNVYVAVFTRFSLKSLR